jgi:DNA-directed RNA polymerase alpha subunit
MSEPRKTFTLEEARTIGEEIGIDWTTSPYGVEEFRAGMDVELEHGLHDPETNVTDDDPRVTGKIARAHLNEFPDYYTRLEQMEQDAKRDWAQGSR